MRRSSAPSSRYGSTYGCSGNEVRSTLVKGPQFPNAARSTASILNLLNDENEDKGTPEYHTKVNTNANSPDPLTSLQVENQLCDSIRKVSSDQKLPVQDIQTADTCLSPSAGKRIFNVVWGKQSTKKHKTWEGDGILEVEGKSAVLKDTEGKIMGRASGIKTATLSEGSRLLVGGKEVEILELINSVGAESPAVNTAMKRPVSSNTYLKPESKKRSKISSALAVPTERLTGESGSKKYIPHVVPQPSHEHMKYKPLVMPRPSHEHQWEYNTARLPVVDVEVDNSLVRILRPHQRLGIVFLYECIMGLRKMGFHGAILADEMGLGKTLQCITLVWTLLKKGPYGGRPVLKRVLIVTPSSLLQNWQKEFSRWLGMERLQVFAVEQKNKPKDYRQKSNIPVMLISYEMLSRNFSDIHDIQFDLLICDEGHRLKNSNIKVSTLLAQLNCRGRILLTGTPIQNDLQEFYSLVNFVNPGLLRTNAEFHKYFEEPIVLSRQPDIDDEVKKLGEQRASELNQNTSWFVLRRTQDVIDKYLTTKQEVVLFCKMSEVQIKLYTSAVDYWENRLEHVGTDTVPHLSVIITLKKICNHPSLALNSVTDNSECLSQYLLEKFSFGGRPDFSLEDSGKLSLVVSLLHEIKCYRERIVLVSYFTQTLDLLQLVCEKRNYKYCRLDGSTPTAQRQSIVDKFNRVSSDCFVFLLSARAGGVGLNLIGASRLVLFDSDWNPATDLQAMSRIWRDGQKRNVYIYRLLTTGTIEEKIFQRQVSKTGLSGAVVDPENDSAIRLSDEELKDLFTLHCDQECLTHKLLNCTCLGSGEVPVSSEDKENVEGSSCERDCQLQAVKRSAASSNIRMNQLMKWEHHSPPIHLPLLQEMGLSKADHLITYLFKNSTSFREKFL
ncbi:DNA repair and recombination protein RAD54B [Anabrus simplex]|uniref:DNA repair and recombination protein RAD54B n=1 Tax=Anabrus simplex TaxID=316456 RepID=UPI0035A2CCE7